MIHASSRRHDTAANLPRKALLLTALAACAALAFGHAAAAEPCRRGRSCSRSSVQRKRARPAHAISSGASVSRSGSDRGREHARRGGIIGSRSA